MLWGTVCLWERFTGSDKELWDGFITLLSEEPLRDQSA